MKRKPKVWTFEELYALHRRVLVAVRNYERSYTERNEKRLDKADAEFAAALREILGESKP